MNMRWHSETVKISSTKHFALKYLRRWGWTFNDLRDAIRDAYKIEHVGKNKFEIYLQKSGFKKIITAYYAEENEIVCITGSEGGERK